GLFDFRRPIAGDRLLRSRRRSGTAAREQAQRGEYENGSIDDQRFLHFASSSVGRTVSSPRFSPSVYCEVMGELSVRPTFQRFSLTSILSVPVAFISINSLTETFFSPRSRIFFT